MLLLSFSCRPHQMQPTQCRVQCGLVRISPPSSFRSPHDRSAVCASMENKGDNQHIVGSVRLSGVKWFGGEKSMKFSSWKWYNQWIYTLIESQVETRMGKRWHDIEIEISESCWTHQSASGRTICVLLHSQPASQAVHAIRLTEISTAAR